MAKRSSLEVRPGGRYAAGRTAGWPATWPSEVQDEAAHARGPRGLRDRRERVTHACPKIRATFLLIEQMFESEEPQFHLRF